MEEEQETLDMHSHCFRNLPGYKCSSSTRNEVEEKRSYKCGFENAGGKMHKMLQTSAFALL